MNCQLMEQMDSQANEMKLVVAVAALKLAQGEGWQETFELLGRKYLVESNPEERQITIRLLDPGGFGMAMGIIASALTLWI